jgi:hypothetical protein
MVNYTCLICNKKFDRKCNYIDHIDNKKKPCRQKNAENADFSSETLTKASQYLTTDLNKENKLADNLEYSCLYCGNIFTRKDNQLRHIIKFCKVKKLQDEEKENIFKLLLKKENDEQKETINELKNNINALNDKINILINKVGNKNINKGIINNNQNIIITSDKLLKFGNENLSKISNKLFDNVLNYTGKKCFIECAKNIYNNPSVPENRNVYISDISRDKCMTYDGKYWQLDSIKKILNEVSEQIRKYIDMNENKLKNKLKDPKFKNKFETKLKKYYNLYYGEDSIATNMRMEEFQRMVDGELMKYLYNIKEEIKDNYNKLLEEAKNNNILLEDNIKKSRGRPKKNNIDNISNDSIIIIKNNKKII